jgi:hypothetical protein
MSPDQMLTTKACSPYGRVNWQHATNGNDQTAREDADTEWAQAEEIEGEVDDVEELDPVFQR